jgi:hypothetical protein
MRACENSAVAEAETRSRDTVGGGMGYGWEAFLSPLTKHTHARRSARERRKRRREEDGARAIERMGPAPPFHLDSRHPLSHAHICERTRTYASARAQMRAHAGRRHGRPGPRRAAGARLLLRPAGGARRRPGSGAHLSLRGGERFPLAVRRDLSSRYAALPMIRNSRISHATAQCLPIPLGGEERPLFAVRGTSDDTELENQSCNCTMPAYSPWR